MISSGMMLKGRYEIIDEIGRGGMAVVYRIMDHTLHKQAALKMIKKSLQQDEGYLKRFIREAQAAAKLSHPNIVDVYDVDQDRGHWFIVMELIEGMTLKQYIQSKGRLSSTECIGISLQAADALNTAHRAGIIHRDIKPDNIIITTNGNVKISDFGIARMQSSDTMTVDACGSVYYSSPEQVRGGYSDQRTDIYSLGVTMYEMCTGKLPFVGKSVVEIAMHHMEGNVIAPKDMYGDISSRLNLIILKAMNKRMDDRYQSMGEMLRDLKLCLKSPEGTTLHDPVREDNTDKTMIFTHKQMKQIEEQISGSEKKKKPKRQKKKAENTDSVPKKSKKKSREEDYRQFAYDEEPEDEYEDNDMAAGLQKALNIGLIIVIFIVVLFVLEFVLTSMGMLKGIGHYLPSLESMGEWFGDVARKLNSMNIGKYLRDGVSRIMEIFRR